MGEAAALQALAAIRNALRDLNRAAESLQEGACISVGRTIGEARFGRGCEPVVPGSRRVLGAAVAIGMRPLPVTVASPANNGALVQPFCPAQYRDPEPLELRMQTSPDGSPSQVRFSTNVIADRQLHG